MGRKVFPEEVWVFQESPSTLSTRLPYLRGAPTILDKKGKQGSSIGFIPARDILESQQGEGRREEEKLGRIVPFHLAKTRGPLIYRSLLLPIHRAALPSFSSSRKKKRRLITRKGESSKKIPPKSYFNHFVRGGRGRNPVTTIVEAAFFGTKVRCL